MDTQIAAATTVGVDHLRAGRSGQDAWHIESSPDALVAVVTDGCGSARQSEIGAKAGAAIFARALAAHRPDWQAAAAEAAARIRTMAEAMGGAFEETVLDSFLFTVVAAVVTEAETVILSRGDGLFAVNGQLTALGPFAGNAPPYFGYTLLDGEAAPLEVARRLRTREVATLLIATDGAAPLLSEMELWSDDRLFSNRDALRRRLFRMTPHDDATLVLIRRRHRRVQPWLD